MNNNEWIEEEKDPDYNEFHQKPVFNRTKLKEEDTKNKTVEKIRTILVNQFKIEIEAKEHEVSVISGRINDCKVMLDRLRAYVVASYYGSGENIIPTTKAIRSSKRKVDDYNDVDEKLLLIKKPFQEKFPDVKLLSSSLNINLSSGHSLKTEEKTKIVKKISETSRFYLSHKVIVGNVSKYLGNENNKENDKSTHKWMVYVRGPKDNPDISSYVKSVWFFLHPSYIPNDVVQVNSAPFQLTRRGWGEFPVRVQLHFKDSQSKRFDIIHHLKLDKTFTGLQTLGAETIVNLQLHRHAKDSQLFIDTSNTEGNYENTPKSSSDSTDLFNGATDFGKPSPSLKTDTLISSLRLGNNLKNDISDYGTLNGHSDHVKKEHDSVQISKLDVLSRKKNEQLKLLTISPIGPSGVSSCVTSTASSRCSSPVSSPKVIDCYTFDDEIDSVLRRLVTNARLICPTKKLCFRSFTCPSLEQYKLWSFSKRRASEWQRASFMRKLFHKYTKVLNPPSTKQIMIWCRRNGYTPSEKSLKVLTNSDEYNFCYLCGVLFENEYSIPSQEKWCDYCIRNIYISNKTFETLTSCHEILCSILPREKTMTSLNNLGSQNNEENEVVDVTSINKKVIMKQPVNVEIITSKELEWVYETANSLDIHLPTLTINGVKGPFLQAMLLTATKCFLSELLRKSYSSSGERNTISSNPSMITYNNIFKSIQNTSKFDFLTDACMGKVDTSESPPES